MLNNRGQSLVLFVLMIPIILGIMTLVIDGGNVFNEKNNIDNTIEFVLGYGLGAMEKENDLLHSKIQPEGIELTKEKYLKVLLDYNLKDNQNKIKIEDNVITISSKTYVKGIFSNILNIKGFLIESEYQGYLEENKKIIKKIK